MQKNRGDPRSNQEGYMDLTPYQAIHNLEDFEEGYERFRKILKIIFTLCSLADFKVGERIVLIDKRTGKTWR